jgi:hypothetical protein
MELRTKDFQLILENIHKVEIFSENSRILCFREHILYVDKI